MDMSIEQSLGNSVKDNDLKVEIEARYKLVSDFYNKWEAEAKDDYSFALGDQWKEEDRQVLEEGMRPCLTFNRIRPIISLISGYQRENSARIKVNPEGGEDKVFSEVFDKVLVAIDKWSHLTYKLGYLFDDGLYCGKGWIEGMITYDADPIRGELKFKQLSPYQVKSDPECLDYDINEGAEYCFKTVRLTKENLKYLFPKKKKLIDKFIKDNDDPVENGAGTILEGDNDDYGNNPNKTTVVKVKDQLTDDPELEKDMKFTLKEYWYKKKVSRYYVIDKESGEPQEFEDKKEADFFAEQQGMKVIDREVDEMWVASMVCGHILQNEKSPFEPHYSGFPFFRFMADWAPNADSEKLRVQGITRSLKDPQREKNKAKSQYLHILNTQANSGWVADDNALSQEGFKDLENLGSVPGIVIRKRAGTELREILPKGPNAGHIQREQAADEEFKQVSAINPDLMGFQEGTASGKAIALRVKQAILSLVRLFSNFRYTKESVGRFMLQMTPAVFDAKKIMKVVGQDYMQKVVDPIKYPEGLNEGHISAFLQMVKDNKYDVLVTESDHNSTVRFETFNQLMELANAKIPIPPDLIIDFMDLPNGEEIKNKMQQQQQAAMEAAQQQSQLEQAKVQSDIEAQKAEIELKKADLIIKAGSQGQKQQDSNQTSSGGGKK